MKTGFTLIELLVVVLIIGILASIALPQYTRAVERARLTEARTVLDSVAKAQTVYYLYHGQFTNDLGILNSEGDITVQDAGAAWNDIEMATEIFPPEGHGGRPVFVRLTRSSGLYEGCSVSILVYPDGFVSKMCGTGSLEAEAANAFLEFAGCSVSTSNS